MKKLAIAILAVFTLGAAAQYTYEKKHDYVKTITKARAGTYLTLLRTDGAWPSQVPIEALYHCDLWPIFADGKVTSAKVECHGKETGVKVPSDMLPKGATVDEVHN